MPLAVVCVGGVAAGRLIQTAPHAKPRPPVRTAAMVETTPVSYSSENTTLTAMGTVCPALEVELKPRVSGEVISIGGNLLPGGLFRAGQTLLKLDPTDYRLAVRRLKSDAAKARADVKLEQGNQSIAQREYQLLGQVVADGDRELMLRKPQLDTVLASVEAVKAELEAAELDLSRTTVTAPFNGVVKTRNVNVGSRVNETTTLACLVGTDEYWIEVSVPVNQLRWIRIPRRDGEPGSVVKVYNQAAWGKDVCREGTVIRLAADLEEQGRMARLLVSVTDPLSLTPDHTGKPVLLIGSYVRLEIQGIELDSVVAVDRSLLRDGTRVWIMSPEGTLDIRPVEICFRDRNRVMISGGLSEGERLVTSTLSTPVHGMELRTSEDIRGSETSPPDRRPQKEARS